MILKILSYTFLLAIEFGNEVRQHEDQKIQKRTSYYFSNEGNDNNDGSINHPLKTLSTIKIIHFNAGDSILLRGNEIFNDSIILTTNGTSQMPIVVASYGNNNAIINAGNETAITIYQSSFINIKNITCKGSGRKNGNTKPGINVSNCQNINVSGIDVSGFQKSGVQLYNCINTKLKNINAHDNGAAGIGVEGDFSNKLTSRNIFITNCNAVNNPGDPANLTNHSGNGIIVGHSTNVLIDHCMATNNGWDMPRKGNGPVGIWCYEADSVIIQHCLSFKNQTSKGGEDGGGYDLDGGTTNSIIQYCLSYKNQGSAFGIFQYAGASSWYNNVIRFCISENDGKVSTAHAGAYIWNGSGDSSQFKSLLFYNNTVYNDSGAALNYNEDSKHLDFKFYNNIFISADELIKGNYTDDVFIANDWWSLKNGFNINGEHDFKKWCKVYNKEQLNGIIRGLNVNLLFKNSANANIADANTLPAFDDYKITRASAVIYSGLDLQALFNISIGDKDFNGESINKKYLGACTNK